jgi:hypothetical protein
MMHDATGPSCRHSGHRSWTVISLPCSSKRQYTEDSSSVVKSIARISAGITQGGPVAIQGVVVNALKDILGWSSLIFFGICLYGLPPIQ